MEDSMKLHEDQLKFIKILDVASNYFEIRQVYIEKDYWVSRTLKELSLSMFCDAVVFKGGTSLSKAYKIIDRFSEDVDLALIKSEEMTGNKIKNLLSAIENTIMKKPIVVDKNFQYSKGSRIRKTGYRYPRLVNEEDFGHAVDTLILEINGDHSTVSDYCLEGFELNVLDVSRTFTEKLMGLIRVSSIEDHQYIELKKRIRHFYDIHKIIESGIIKNFLESPNFQKTVDLVLEDEVQNQDFQKFWVQGKMIDTNFFDQLEEILEALKSTYKESFESLLFRPENEKFLNLKKSFNELKNIIQLVDINLEIKLG